MNEPPILYRLLNKASVACVHLRAAGATAQADELHGIVKDAEEFIAGMDTWLSNEQMVKLGIIGPTGTPGPIGCRCYAGPTDPPDEYTDVTRMLITGNQ